MLLMFLPASGVQAQTAIAHPFDNSVLLMISSQMRLDGEVQSALLPGGRVQALSRQAASGNEIDVLLQLYTDQIAKLRASDDYDPNLEAKLISQLEDKVDALRRQAQELAASRSRRRGGLFGFLGRAVKSLGRATGWLMGKTMDGAGEIAEFAIEDVAPQVLKEAVQNGAPLNAALVRRVARELLINRVTDAIARERQKRAERLAEIDSDPAADATWEADFMEAFEEGDENSPAGSNSGSSGGGNVGADIVIYDFTASDAFNFTTGTIGGLSWVDYWRSSSNGDSFTLSSIELSAGSVHLEFNRTEMTASGWVEGSGQSESNAYSQSGNFRVEFSDLPLAAPSGFEPEVALRFSGTGTGTASISGSVLFSHRNPEGGPDTTYTSSGQVSNHNPVPVTISLYIPGYTSGSHPITMNINSYPGAEPASGFEYSFSFSFDQPIDLPLP